MTLIKGAVGSNDLPTNARYIDGEGKIYWNKKRMDFPLISFLGMYGRSYEQVGEAVGAVVNVSGKALAKRQVKNAQFEIFQDEQLGYSTQINLAAGYAAGDTSIVVDDGTQFVANDQLYVPRTGEVMLVSAVSTNTLTVVRGVGSTAAALVDNDYVVRLSSAYPVNALSGTAKNSVPTRAYNYALSPVLCPA